MEENKVVLKLEEYISLIKENENLKQKLENKENNYIALCTYVKEEAKSSEDYHLRNIENNFNIENTLNSKFKNYHYENIANAFIRTGITFDLVEKLTDELIKERKEKENNE